MEITFMYYGYDITIYGQDTTTFYWAYPTYNENTNEFSSILGAFFSDIEECIKDAKLHIYNKCNK